MKKGEQCSPFCVLLPLQKIPGPLRQCERLLEIADQIPDSLHTD